MTEEQREKKRRQALAYYHQNKDRFREIRNARDRERYAAEKGGIVRPYGKGTKTEKGGLSVEEFNRRLVEQSGLCAICKCQAKDRQFVVDHCHTRGNVRGLICNTCNLGLGLFFDDPIALREAASYIERSRE